MLKHTIELADLRGCIIFEGAKLNLAIYSMQKQHV